MPLLFYFFHFSLHARFALVICLFVCLCLSVCLSPRSCGLSLQPSRSLRLLSCIPPSFLPLNPSPSVCYTFLFSSLFHSSLRVFHSPSLSLTLYLLLCSFIFFSSLRFSSRPSPPVYLPSCSFASLPSYSSSRPPSPFLPSSLSLIPSDYGAEQIKFHPLWFGKISENGH